LVYKRIKFTLEISIYKTLQHLVSSEVSKILYYIYLFSLIMI
jgi:hypothetical protein